MRWPLIAALVSACAWEVPEAVPVQRSALNGSVALQSPEDFERGGNFESNARVTPGGISRSTGTPFVESWVAGPPMALGRRGHAFFAWDGFLYAVGGCPATAAGDTCGQPTAPVEVAALASDGGWGTWRTSAALPVALERFGWAVYGGKLYVVGGFDGTADTAQTWWATLTSDGGVGPFLPGPSLPQPREQVATVAYRGQLYAATGSSDAPATTFGDVLRAPILPGGGLGPFVSEGAAATARSSARAFAHDGRLYLSGGLGSQPLADIHAATIADDGHLSGWVNVGSLPEGLANPAAAVVSTHLLSAGGVGGATSGTDQRTMALYESGEVSDGPSLAPPLQLARDDATMTQWHGQLYLSGGKGAGGIGLTSVMAAPVSLGASQGTSRWVASSPLPSPLKQASVAGSPGRLWVTGGCTSWATGATTCTGNAAQTLVGQLDTLSRVTSWSATTPLAQPRSGHCSFIHRNHLVVVGGQAVLPDGGVATRYTDISFAALLADGGIGPWVIGSDRLSEGVSSAGCALWGDIALVMGGTTAGGDTAQVLRVPLKEGDTAGPVAVAGALSVARTDLAAAAIDGFAFALGGTSPGGPVTVVESFEVLDDGGVGPRIAGGPLRYPRAMNFAATSAGTLFAVGGYSSVGIENMEYTFVQAGGVVSSYIYEAGFFPTSRSQDFGTATAGRLFMLGGQTSAAQLSDVQSVTVAGGVQRGEYSYTFDLGEPMQLGQLSLVATAGRGAIDLKVRLDDGQGAFGPTIDLGRWAAGQPVTLPQGPARFVWVDVVFDDRDQLRPGFTPLRTMTRLQLDYSTFDAGTAFDGGTDLDAGQAPGGDDGGNHGDGGPHPLSLRVGCGCGASSVASTTPAWLALALLSQVTRRRRPT